MEKTFIKVPGGVRYLSEFRQEDGKQFKLPYGVFAKGQTGCGGTTLALDSPRPTIICSPRKALIECKARQYPQALLVEGGVSTREVEQYVASTPLPKILVTYDSMFKVAQAVRNKEDYDLVADEFQNMLTDASFKSDALLRFMSSIRDFPNVTFMSATPMLDKYLEQIPLFRDMPYTELVWEDAERIRLDRLRVNKPIVAIMKIVENYQKGDFPIMVVDGRVVESREVCIFVNSVQNICNIIRKCRLKADEVNIIVGDNEENDDMLARLGSDFHNGSAPLQGEPHKMVTLCTSTAFAGVDFYSTCASTFVVSDCTRQNTSIDIATELTQIAGRQRLRENPFRGVLHFIYNTNALSLDEDEFRQAITSKLTLSQDYAASNNSDTGEVRQERIKELERRQRIQKYSEIYTYYDADEDTFKVNKLAYLSEQFCYDVQMDTYRNGLRVRRLIEDTGAFDVSSRQGYELYKEQVENVITRTTFEEKMRTYLDYKEAGNEQFNLLLPKMERDMPELKDYYQMLGARKIRALGCKQCNLQAQTSAIFSKKEVQQRLCQLFNYHQHYTTDEVKAIINSVYKDMNLKQKATAKKLTDEYGFSVIKHKDTFLDGRKVTYEITEKPL